MDKEDLFYKAIILRREANKEINKPQDKRIFFEIVSVEIYN